VNEVQTAEAQKRHLSPWFLIGGIVVMAMVAVAVLTALATHLAPPPSAVPQGVAQSKLADGSVLVLHGITDGNQLELPEITSAGWKEYFARLFGKPEQTVTLHGHSSGGNALTLWLSRYDATTGSPLEFDRWSHSVLTTPAGSHVYDSSYASRDSRRKIPHVSTSSTSSVRPFHSLEIGSYSHILYSSSVPRVRSSTGTVEVSIHHLDNGRVATFEVPLTGGPATYPS
jgi:hypothetical protein